MFPRNTLFYGDNLDWLRDRSQFPDECVDLIYLDPPFNSNRKFNVLFKDRTGSESSAQIRAFDDTWSWGPESEETFIDLTQRGFAPGRVQDAMLAFRQILGANDLFAYLVMMTARLVELHRVLKPTGSLYLHCDPTASHYLKMVLDAIFEKENFRNEVVWKRTSSHNDSKRFADIHDCLLYFAKSKNATWHPQHVAHNDRYLRSHYGREDAQGRRYRLDNIIRSASMGPRPNLAYEYKGFTLQWGWRVVRSKLEELDANGRLAWSSSGTPYLVRYLDEMPGAAMPSVWDDIPPVNSQAKERLGFLTQKPLALLERIIAASSDPNDVVLDAFCGCGTTIDAAQRLDRRWVGIDITILAVDLILKRVRATYGDEVADAVRQIGVPNEPVAASALFAKDPFEFERWVVTMVDGQPNERSKQQGDHGIDGVVRFAAEFSREGTIQRVGRSLVSVKGGQHLTPSMVRDLRGTVERERAEMGLLLTLNQPSSGMRTEAKLAGKYVWSWNNMVFPRLQIATVEDLLSNRKPEMPMTIPPYTRAQRLKMDAGQLTLF